MKSLKQLKRKDLKELREKWTEEQDYICPLFGSRYTLDLFVIDHLHKLKAEEPDENGKGLCRGSIHFQANSIEGKITSAFKRLGGNKHIDLPTFLRNLADYLENNKSSTDEKYIHPSEEVKPPKLMKRSYNELKKVIAGKQKLPMYNQKLTKALAELFKKYGVQPELRKKNQENSKRTNQQETLCQESATIFQ